MNRRIYLLRHCQPLLPTDETYCLGHWDVPLSPEGITQAQQLQQGFSTQSITAIYGSDLSRSSQTARIIGQGLDLVPTLCEQLREIDMGQWDGLTFGQIKQQFPQEYRARGADFANYVVPHGESFAQCAKRAKKALNMIVEQSVGDIIIVGHAGFNRAFLWDLAGRPSDDLLTQKQDYGGITLLNIIEDTHSKNTLIWKEWLDDGIGAGG